MMGLQNLFTGKGITDIGISKDGSASLDGYKQHLSDAGVQFQKFSMKSILANAATGFLVGAGIELAIAGVTKLIDYTVHYNENLIKKGEEARDTIQQQTDAYNTQKSTLTELTTKYRELSKGVKISGNQIKNINLTDDQYKDFLQTANDIASAAPSLVSAWDNEGNAILKAGTNVNDLNKQISDYLTLQRDLTHYNTKDNIADQYKGLLTESKQAQAEMNQYQIQADYAQARYESLNSFYDELQKNKNKGVQTFSLANSEDEVLLRKSFINAEAYLNSWANEGGGVSLTIDTSQIDENELSSILTTIGQIRDEANATESEYLQKLQNTKALDESNWREIFPSIQSLVDTTSLFDSWDNQELATTFKDNISSMVSNMDMSDVSKSIEKSGKDIYDWTMEDVVQPLSQASKEQQETWNELFNFEPDKSESISAAAKRRDALLEEVAAFSDNDYWTKSTLAKALGYAHTDDNGKTVWNTQEKLNQAQEAMKSQGEELRDWMKSLNAEDFEIAYSVVGNDDEEAFENLGNFQTKFEEIKESIARQSEMEQYSLSAMKDNVTSAQTALSNYSSAISESMSNTGLTADSIEAIKTQFSELEGLDLNGLFTNTAEGVKLNSDALENLIDVQHKTKTANFADAIKKQSDAIKKYKSDTDSATKQTKEYKDTLSGMEDELANIQQAQSQYHALYLQQKEMFSDYAKWQNAQSTENAGDKYTSMVSGLKEAKEAWDKGLVGTDDFKSFAALISPTGAEDAVNFAENYAKAKRYLTEDVSGAKNFLNDLEAKGLAEYNAELEQWSLNVKDMAEASRQMGMGKDFMSAMFGRLEDYGFHNNVIMDAEDGVLKLSEAYSNLAKSEAELQDMESNPDNYNSTAIEAKRQEVEGYQRDVEELNSNLDYFVNNYADEYNQKLETAKSSIEMLNEQRKKILESNKYGENTSAIANQMESQIKQWADEYNLELDAECNVTGVKGDSLDKLKELQDSDSGVISKEIELEYNIDTMSESEIDAKINELNNEKARIQVEVDSEKGQSAIEQIDNEVSALNDQKITLHIQQAVDDGTSIDKLLAIDDDQTLATTLDIDISQVDTARQQLESLQDETAETSISVTIDESQFDEILNRIDGESATITVNEEQGTTVEPRQGEEITDTVNEVPGETVENEDTEKTVTVNEVPGAEVISETETKNITVNETLGQTVDTVPDAQGTSNFDLGDSPETVPDASGIADFSLGKSPLTVPDATGVVNFTLGNYPTSVPAATQVVNQVLGLKVGKASGTMLSPAKASGTAYNVLNMKPLSRAHASGKVTLPQNERALVNEEEVNGHSESIVRDGKWFLIPGGAHFENLKKGDLIFNAKQTDELLKHGRTNSHARAYADGTVGNWFANSYDSGSMWGSFQGGLAGSGKTGTGSSNNTSNSINKAASSLSSAADSTKSASDALADLIKKISDNVQDWIEVLISRTESKIEYYQAVSENRKSIKKKNKYLTQAESEAGKEAGYYKQAEQRYLSYANEVAVQIGLSDDLKAKVQNGTVDIQQLSEDDKSRVEAYMKWYDKAIESRKAAEEKLTEQVEIAAKKLENITDIYDSYTNRTKAKQDLNNAKLEYRETTGMTISNGSGYYKLLNQQISYEKNNISMLQKEYKEYEKQLKAYGKKYGTKSAEYREMQTTLIGINEELWESKTALEEWKKEVREAKEQLKQWGVDRWSRASDKLSAARNYKEVADGYTVTEKDHKERIKNNNREMAAITKLRNQKTKELSLYAYNSKEYQDLADEIAQLDVNYMNLAADSEEAKNAIMDIRWKPFYEAQEAIDGVVNEYDTLRGLMDSDTFISESDGSFTENGLTNLLLLQESVDATKTKIANYRKQIENLNKQYKKGDWSQEEYNDKLKELHDGLLDSAKAMETYKQSMLDMYEEQLKKKNELMHEDIDAYQKALEAKKKYHDYDKKLKSQTRELNILKAQAAALESVSDAASKARLAQIKAQIAEQEEELEDTKYEHSYELKSDGYDKLADDVDKALDKTLDSLRTNTDMQNQVINGMLSNVTTSYESTFANLDNIVTEHGLVMSDTFNNVFDKLDEKMEKALEDGVLTAKLYNTGDVQDTKADKKVTKSDNSKVSTTTKENEKNLKKVVANSDDSNNAGKGGGSGEAYVRATDVKLSKTSISLKEGKTYTLKATVKPSNAAANFTWSSSNTKVAKVSSSGVVTAVSAGSATISVKESRSRKTAKCKVTVKAKAKQPTKQPVKQTTSNNTKKPPTTTQNTNTDIWAGIAKDTSMKGNKSLNIEQSIYDRIAYNGYKTGYASQKQLYTNLKGSGTYSGTAEQNTWMVNKLKGSGYAKGGLVDQFIQLPPDHWLNQLSDKNDDAGIVTVNPGEYILPEHIVGKMGPALDTMENFNENVRKYSSYSNHTTNQAPVINYDSLITVNGNVDKDVMGDLETLAKQLVNNKNFVNGMTGKVSTNLTQNMYKAGFNRRVR
ncbi:MAG: Ig-like domain-containing protein [Eubacteriales bacterium]|nr:Ig-like domain-containing protein [Eubacteriales bacterium]